MEFLYALASILFNVTLNLTTLWAMHFFFWFTTLFHFHESEIKLIQIKFKAMWFLNEWKRNAHQSRSVLYFRWRFPAAEFLKRNEIRWS